jgi:DNA-binding XRE family transcriptional regulator
MPKPHVLCNLRQILANAKRSQVWLAERLDMDPTVLNRIIAGRRNPRVTFARRVSKILNVPIESIWPGATPKRRK